MILNALEVSVLLFRVQKDGKCISEDMKRRLENLRAGDGMGEERRWRGETREKLFGEFSRKVGAKASAYIFFSVQLVYL